MGLKTAWRAVSTGWVIEFPDRERGPEDIFSSRLTRPESSYGAVELEFSRAPKNRRTVSEAELHSPPPEYRFEDGATSSETFIQLSSSSTLVLESCLAGTTQAESLGRVEHVFPRPVTQTSSNSTSGLQATPRRDYAEQPIQQDLQQAPPPYTKPPQFRAPSPWAPHMSNSQARHWLAEHFLVVTNDLTLASQLANKYRYGNGNNLFNMSFKDLCDVDGVKWATIVWGALGR